MWKKTLMALAAVVAFAGLTAVVDSTPAAAQPGMHRPPMAGMPTARPRMGGMHRPPSGRFVGAPRHRWPGPGRHHRPRGWYGPGLLFPPGVYGLYGGYEECRIVRKRVRVLTDHGWRLRWRKVRYCS